MPYKCWGVVIALVPLNNSTIARHALQTHRNLGFGELALEKYGAKGEA